MPRGRIPRPWLRRSTGQWYVTLDGKQVPLGHDKRAAHDEFARLMVGRVKGPLAQARLTLRDMAAAWLADCERRKLSPRTIGNYRHTVKHLVEHMGGMIARDVAPHHIMTWVDSHKSWGQAQRCHVVGHVKILYSWAEAQGLLESNPVRRLRKPAMPRRAPTSLEDFGALLEQIPKTHRAPILFLRLTGIRPGELCSMRVEQTDLAQGVAVVRGKTGSRTVALSSAAQVLLSSVIGSRKEGPVWINRYKKAMQVWSLSDIIRRHRPPELSHVVPHGMRGLYGTQALRAGVDSLLVAKLLGHSNVTMLMKHYEGLDLKDLKDAADKASGQS